MILVSRTVLTVAVPAFGAGLLHAPVAGTTTTTKAKKTAG